VPDEASVVLDREGGELGHLYRVNRTIVPLDSLPSYLPKAFIAVEDQRFWQHRGVDWVRVVGAAWVNLRARRVEEGFSTITMQLARNVFPKRIPQSQRTLGRKLTEMRVAGQIERHFTKRQILELYLNQIYFGDGAYGIAAAAAEYFGKPASRLTLGEAAALAGLIRAPQRLSPHRNPQGARGRRGVVLEKMVEQGMITPTAAREASAEPLRVHQGAMRRGDRAAYFVEEVRQAMEEELGESLYTDGYLIHTTLDPAVQAAAEAELEAQLRAIEAGRIGLFRHPRRTPGTATTDSAGGEETRYLQGAVVVMDAEHGDLLALVGGRDFGDSKFDRAMQARRQPGSAFKPFVFGAALAAGYPPTLILSDEPLHRVLPDGTIWEPRNFEGSYRGPVTMRDALVQSRNVATIRLAEEVGLDKVIDFARRLGLSGPIPAVPSIAIGAAEVTLLEMTAAYAAFATLGRRPTPRLVTRVEDRAGNVVWSRPAQARRVIDPAVAFVLTDLMRGVVDRGTGTAVRAAGFRNPAAGKTGTTNGSTDVWFLGFTPQRVAGVWIGFDRPQSIVPGATGGRLAAPVWGRLMRRTTALGGAGWAPPPGVEERWVDAAGHTYQDGCPTFGELRPEYFLAGTTPPHGCSGTGSPLLGRPIGPGGWPDSGLVVPGSPGDRDTTGDSWWDSLRRRTRAPHPDSGGAYPATPGRSMPGDSGLVKPPPTRDGWPGHGGWTSPDTTERKAPGHPPGTSPAHPPRQPPVPADSGSRAPAISPPALRPRPQGPDLLGRPLSEGRGAPRGGRGH
jgi:penicillin-binding protein 1A